jgi:hypothetical protein
VADAPAKKAGRKPAGNRKVAEKIAKKKRDVSPNSSSDDEDSNPGAGRKDDNDSDSDNEYNDDDSKNQDKR